MTSAPSTATASPTTRTAWTAPPVAPTAPVRLRPLAPGDARITGGFWSVRQQRNRSVALREGHAKLEEFGTLDNFRIAAGTREGEARGPIFQDSDAYKWLEAVAFEIGREDDPELREMQESVTAVIASAQAEDGYLNSVHQLRHGLEERYTNLAWNHELYCYGHLFQAAVAQSRCTGDDALLEVSLRALDHLGSVFGPGRHEGVAGHPEIEMALVELYRHTGRRDALDLARFLLERRGHGAILAEGIRDATYFSDRVPVREARTVEGHAVRALYLASGVADLAIEDGDEELLRRQEELFATMLATKTYVTGGMGSRWEGEAYGDPYELGPDRAYAETCAGIAAVQWAWRLLLATGREQYADFIERALYNAVLPGVSLSGTEYFYVNALQLRSQAHATTATQAVNGRGAWFDCACCPPNVMRTLASLDQYAATADAEGLQLHQYAEGVWTARLGEEALSVEVATGYPHAGQVRLRILEAPAGEAALSLRVPAWSASAELEDREGTQQLGPGLHTIRRVLVAGEELTLRLDLGARFVGAPHRLDASRGAVALERGPLVYALEQVDQTGPALVDDALVDPAAPVAEHPLEDLDGVVALDVAGWASPAPQVDVDAPWPYRPVSATAAVPGAPCTWRAIPYYAWANREVGPMRVWLPAAGA
ncbi:hypothetical protein BF93_04120 [Brachybacterium phenoliresistens]|uniref:Glycosyl hydrolase n=1 Tax=Brachybacterium phenoliresistens TaxID=396014 RepID=Z9JPP5_9MICO|nr:beta-L-arabinofuranosidase domain-containing protein [Brachybacterium phenoliresistens]EWS80375.1 hypothetical protein BF93_04120 [Brachybacterium phenoliresistens]